MEEENIENSIIPYPEHEIDSTPRRLVCNYQVQKGRGAGAFEKYNSKPFQSLKSDFCQEETDECIFNDFKNWVSHENQEFLYTYEPYQSFKFPFSAKCPYLHTGLSCEEKEEQRKEIEKQLRIREEIHMFLKKRLILVQRLIVVYRKAKRGIEKEYATNLSVDDPYCDFKRESAMKRIVYMMVKQMALEYLYLKSVKIKKEIEQNICLIYSTSYLSHLKHIYKYTIRTAEKLRCLLDMECLEEEDNVEVYFEEWTLRNMARMYLNEIENFNKTSEQYVFDSSTREFYSEPDDTSRVSFKCTSPVPEGSISIKLGEVSSTVQGEHDEESKPRSVSPNDTSSTRESIPQSKETESITEEELGDEVSTEHDYDLLGEDFDEIVQPEKVHEEISLREMRKEMLKSEDAVSQELADSIEDKEETNTEDEYKTGIMRSEIRLVEEFKREIWLMEAFHFYSTKVRPELARKLTLVHVEQGSDSRSYYSSELWLDDDTSLSMTVKCPSELDKSIPSESRVESKHSKADLTQYNEIQTVLGEEIRETVEQSSPRVLSVASLRSEEKSQLSLSGSQMNYNQTVTSIHTSPTALDSTKRHQDTLTNINGSDKVRGQSIPSFTGSLPDPFKQYRKCVESRDQNVDDNVDVAPISEREFPLYPTSENNSIYSGEGDFRSDFDQKWSSTMEPIPYEFDISRSSCLSIARREEEIRSQLRSEKGETETTDPNAKKCLPTLLEIMRYFTQHIVGRSEHFETIYLDNGEEDKASIKWKQLTELNWKISYEKNRDEELSKECGIDLKIMLNKLRKSNVRYMRTHPEMTGIIVLLLREFTAKKPKNEFVKFICHTLYNRQFAKQLTSHVLFNSQEFRERKGFDSEDNFKCWNSEQKSKMFSFYKGSLEYWTEWGVDFKQLESRRQKDDMYGLCNEKPEKDLSENPERDQCKGCPNQRNGEKFNHQPPDKKTRYFNNLLSYKKSEMANIKEVERYTEWGEVFKSLLKDQDKDFSKELSCVNVLAKEVVFAKSDSKSSCQKLYLKKNRKLNK